MKARHQAQDARQSQAKAFARGKMLQRPLFLLIREMRSTLLCAFLGLKSLRGFWAFASDNASKRCVDGCVSGKDSCEWVGW